MADSKLDSNKINIFFVLVIMATAAIGQWLLFIIACIIAFAVNFDVLMPKVMDVGERFGYGKKKGVK